MVDSSEFINLMNKIINSRINYWIFGGFALDGIRGHFSRDHDDIDIYVLDSDLEKLASLLEINEFTYIKREKMYFAESGDIKIGIVILTEEPDSFTAHGNKTLAKYPKDLFAKDNLATLDGFTFRIVPNEILYLESQFSKFETDLRLGKSLSIDDKLYANIKTIKIRD